MTARSRPSNEIPLTAGLVVTMFVPFVITGNFFIDFSIGVVAGIATVVLVRWAQLRRWRAETAAGRLGNEPDNSEMKSTDSQMNATETNPTERNR